MAEEDEMSYSTADQLKGLSEASAVMEQMQALHEKLNKERSVNVSYVHVEFQK